MDPPRELRVLTAEARLVADAALAERVEQKLASAPSGPSLWVTDLVDPRPAYYRFTHPVAPSPEVAQRRAEGKARHARYERKLAVPSQREVPVERNGVRGQIDLFDEVPTEIKSSRNPFDVARVGAERPSYLEQLAMYCALTDRPVGRLVLVGDPPHDAPTVAVLVCRFEPLEEARQRIDRTATRLRAAIARGTPADLPRCGWFGAGCEFRSAGVCDCTGTEPVARETCRSLMVDSRTDEGLAESIQEKVRTPDGPGGARPTFAELAYPLRAYFERSGPPPADSKIPPTPVPRARSAPSLYVQMRDALEGLDPGQLRQETGAPPSPEEPVTTLGGAPVLLKSSRSPYPPTSAQLPRDRPHYLLELGLRMSALGRSEGLLIIGYEGVAPDQGPVRIHRVGIDLAGPWAGELERRREALDAAVAAGSPVGLPVCPRWMCPSCPYRTPCGDGAAAGPIQR